MTNPILAYCERERARENNTPRGKRWRFLPDQLRLAEIAVLEAVAKQVNQGGGINEEIAEALEALRKEIEK